MIDNMKVKCPNIKAISDNSRIIKKCCDWVGEVKQLHSHQKECKYTPNPKIPCPYKCGLEIEKHNVNYHITHECTQRILKCPFAKYGCNIAPNFKFATLQKHLKNFKNKHMELKCKYYVNQCSLLESKYDTLMKKYNNLVNIVNDNQTNDDDCKIDINLFKVKETYELNEFIIWIKKVLKLFDCMTSNQIEMLNNIIGSNNALNHILSNNWKHVNIKEEHFTVVFKNNDILNDNYKFEYFLRNIIGLNCIKVSRTFRFHGQCLRIYFETVKHCGMFAFYSHQIINYIEKFKHYYKSIQGIN